MFPPDAVSPRERLKAGQGKSGRLRTSRVTPGVNLNNPARRLSPVGTSRRFSENGPQSDNNSFDPCLITGPGIPARDPRRPLDLRLWTFLLEQFFRGGGIHYQGAEDFQVWVGQQWA